MILSYLFVQSDYSFKTIVLCLSIFPNIAHALGIGWSASPQIWSIGVEEQFYLFWPLILFILPEKRVILSLSIFFIGYAILPHFIDYVNLRTLQNADLSSFNTKFFYGTKFNCMAIGALMGYSLAKGKSFVRIFSNSFVLGLTLSTSFCLWFLRFEFKYFTEEIYALLFSMMILGLVSNDRISIDSKLTSFLGKISYGIYMYHWLVIVFVLKFLKFEENPIFFNLAFYFLVVMLTILLSWLSYISVESYFLKLKNKYKAPQMKAEDESL